MKPSTQARYALRLDRVLRWLADHPDRTPDLHQLAGLACLSPYHFHRVYRALVGETLGETAQRMRLQRAARALSTGQDDLARVARQAGYQSAAAFSRAFGLSYGLPPGRYRQQRLLQRANKEPFMYTVHLQAFEGLRLATLEHRGDYQHIGSTFERLGMLAVSQGLVRSPTDAGPWIGVYYDDPRQVARDHLRAHAGVAIAAQVVPAAPLHALQVPAMPCAVLDYVGPYTEIDAAYDWLFSVWLPYSGKEPGDFPAFEEYVNDPKTTPAAELHTRIYLPLSD